MAACVLLRRRLEWLLSLGSRTRKAACIGKIGCRLNDAGTANLKDGGVRNPSDSNALDMDGLLDIDIHLPASLDIECNWLVNSFGVINICRAYMVEVLDGITCIERAGTCKRLCV